MLDVQHWKNMNITKEVFALSATSISHNRFFLMILDIFDALTKISKLKQIVLHNK